MIKSFASLLVAVLAVTSGPGRSHAPEVLQIAVEDGADLWSRPDGTGFANDVVRAAFRAAGVEVSFVVVPYSRCRKMVIEGAVAACFSMSAAPDLKGAVVFPTMPLFRCYTELLQNPAHPVGPARLRDLPRGTVVGTVLGYEYPADVADAATTGTIVLDPSPSEDLLLKKLSAGRVSAALVNVNESKTLAYLLARSHMTGGVEHRARIGTMDSHIGFSVKHARGAWARERFDEGMRRISANGVLAGITRRWSDTTEATVRAARGAPETKRP